MRSNRFIDESQSEYQYLEFFNKIISEIPTDQRRAQIEGSQQQATQEQIQYLDLLDEINGDQQMHRQKSLEEICKEKELEDKEQVTSQSQ